MRGLAEEREVTVGAAFDGEGMIRSCTWRLGGAANLHARAEGRSLTVRRRRESVRQASYLLP